MTLDGKGGIAAAIVGAVAAMVGGTSLAMGQPDALGGSADALGGALGSGGLVFLFWRLMRHELTRLSERLGGLEARVVKLEAPPPISEASTTEEAS